MAKTSIYLPDDLAEQVRAHGIPISEIVQRALRQAVHEAQIKEKVMTDIQAVAERLKLQQEKDSEAARLADATAAANARALGATWAQTTATAEEIKYVATYDGHASDYRAPMSLFLSSPTSYTGPTREHWADLQDAVREIWEQVKPLLAE